jgi:major membrane immunogen (membrane-anchored lipoprotein)
MKRPALNSILCFLLLIVSCSSTDNSLQDQATYAFYYPTLDSDVWETKTMAKLNVNINELKPLLNFLESKNTKGFLIFQDGKIVVEKDFNGQNATLPWYWASVAKT